MKVADPTPDSDAKVTPNGVDRRAVSRTWMGLTFVMVCVLITVVTALRLLNPRSSQIRRVLR
jgi:hypothetical protein